MYIGLPTEKFYFNSENDSTLYSIEVALPLKGEIDIEILAVKAATHYAIFNSTASWPRNLLLYDGDKNFLAVVKIDRVFMCTKIIKSL